jgi:hypothetical protein
MTKQMKYTVCSPAASADIRCRASREAGSREVFATIHEALARAKDNDVVQVFPGITSKSHACF